MAEQDLTGGLADYACKFRLADLGEAERAHLADAFVNWVACAVAGARTDGVDALVAGYAAMGEGGGHALIGRPERAGLIAAASIDCLSSAAQAFDDMQFECGLHPTGPVAAALLAVARLRPLSGQAFLAALHVGMELQCRVALAMQAEGAGAKLGWYPTGLAGGVGAAAAVARVLGMNSGQTGNAMALAAARACGNRGTHGSMAAAYVPSTGAESGLIAAFLTQGGMSCGARALDGANGLLELVADRPDRARALAGLGERSLAAETAFKPYPSGFVTHAAIDACLALARKEGGLPSALALAVSPRAARLGSNPAPRDLLEAQVSIQHWAALAITFRRAGLEESDPALLADPRVADLRTRITVVGDPALADTQAGAVWRGADGDERAMLVEHATGSPGRPMTRAELDAKAGALFASALAPERARALFDRCRDILAMPDVSEILGL